MHGSADGRASPAIRTLSLVERASDDLTRQSIGELAACEQHAAVDHDVVDTDRVALDLHTAARKAPLQNDHSIGASRETREA